MTAQELREALDSFVLEQKKNRLVVIEGDMSDARTVIAAARFIALPVLEILAGLEP